MARIKIDKLIIEPHPKNCGVPGWMTYIQYIDNNTQLVVVDSIDKKYVWGYNIESMSDIESAIFSEIMTSYWDEILYGNPLRNVVPVHEWIYDKGVGEVFGGKLVGYNINNILRLIGADIIPTKYPGKMLCRRRKRVVIRD